MKTGYLVSCRVLLALVAIISAESATAQPNLTPYQPAGWSDKVVVSRVGTSTLGSATDSANLTTADTLYVNWAVLNNGNAATASTFYTALYVDGVYQIEWTSNPPMGTNFFTYVNNWSIGSLSAGSHTVEIVADVTSAIPESNESDNTYTKTINVSPATEPNLTPYQPSGWSDKIVVARTNNTTTGSSNLLSTDPLYVSWAVINNGTAATAGTFYTALYIDGVYQTDWSTAPPLNTNNYVYVEGYSIGTLPAGTHTIGIYADVFGAIPESNENDNTYTNTITINSPASPNLTPYQPAGWSDKIVVSRTNTSTLGSALDSTNLTTSDTLYVSWAVINDGLAPTAATFYTELLVDGVYQNEWSSAPPFNTNVFTYVDNYSIGSLTAGPHTIAIAADWTGAVSESNESDNTYTKNITVVPGLLSAPVPNMPTNATSGQSLLPIFIWSQVTGATSYRIMIATNAADLPTDPTATTGGPSVVTNTTTTGPGFVPAIRLNPNTTYYWEVNAGNGAQHGSWSAVNHFTTSALVNGLVIVPTFDSTITSDPQAATIEATINAAISVYEANFSDQVTVTITYSETGSGVAQSTGWIQQIAYSDYRNALVSHATSADDSTALMHLPNTATNPVNGGTTLDVKLPLARALGFSANPPSGQTDGTIALNTGSMNLSPTQTNPNNYALFSAVSHEMDEVLGFGSGLDIVKNGGTTLTGVIEPEDLWRYDGTGNRSYNTNVSSTSSFSLDSIVNLAMFNQVASGDFGDWFSAYGGQVPQVQDAFGTPGTTPVLGVELRVLDVIGYDRSQPVSAPLPSIQSVGRNGGSIVITWSAVSNKSYQVQYKTNLTQVGWNNLGSSITATNSTASSSDTIVAGGDRFYRIELLSSGSQVVLQNPLAASSGPMSLVTNYFRPFPR